MQFQDQVLQACEPGGTPARRTCALVLAASVALAVCLDAVSWARLLQASDFEAGALLKDDAYYYLLIAENILDGHGASFDARHPTSGFQPLYQLVTLGYVSLARALSVPPVRVVVCGNFLLSVLAAVILWRAVRSQARAGLGLQGLGFVLLLVPLNFPLVVKRLANGMESGLAFLMLAIYARSLLRLYQGAASGRPRGWAELGHGLLLALLCLTRMDYAVFAGAFLLALASARPAGQRFRAVVLPLLTMAAVLGAYALFAWSHLDTVVPVSFLAKRYSVAGWRLTTPASTQIFQTARAVLFMFLYPVVYLLFGLWTRCGGAGLAVGTLVVLALCRVMGRGIGKVLHRPEARGALWLVGAVVLHAVLFAVSGPVFVLPACDWYTVPQLFLLCLTLAWLADRSLHSSRLGPRLACLGLGLFLVVSTALYDVSADLRFFEPLRRSVEIARKTIPPDAVVGSWDAGFNAYWLRPLRTINLDGMTNSRDYLERVLLSEDYWRYFRSENIEYLVNMVADGPGVRSLIEHHYFRSPAIPRTRYEVIGIVPFHGLLLCVLRLEPDPVLPQAAEPGSDADQR